MTPKTRYSLLTFIVLFAVYYPALAPFGIHNDYAFLLKSGCNAKAWFRCFPESDWLFSIGRPLGALAINAQMLLMKNATSFVAWRAAAIVMSGVLAIQFASLLSSRAGFSTPRAALVATLFLLLPAAQLSVLWVTMPAPGLVAPSLGLLAYAALPPLPDAPSRASLFASIRRDHWRYGVAVLLIVVAMLIYPFNALVGLAITAAVVLADQDPGRRQYVAIRDCAVFALCMLIYFVLLKTSALPHSGSPSLPEYQLEVSLSPIKILANLFNIFLIAASSPWNVLVGIHVGFALNVVLVGSVVFAFRGQAVSAGKDAVRVASWALLVSIVTNLPVLLAPKGHLGAFRTSFVTQSIAVLVAAVAAERLWLLARGAALVIVTGYCVVAACFPFFNAIQVRNNATLELDRVTRSLSSAVSRRRDIVFVLKEQRSSYLEWPLRFEFGLPMTTEKMIGGVLEEKAGSIATSGINVGIVNESKQLVTTLDRPIAIDALVYDMKTGEAITFAGSP